MPTYTYMCEKCGYQFDDIYKIVDREYPTTQPCPNCKEEKCIKQLITAVNLVSPFRIDGLIRPPVEFRERMKQIKKNVGPTAAKNIRDY